MLDNTGLERQREGAYMASGEEDLGAFLERQQASYAKREAELKAELAKVQAFLGKIEAALAVLRDGAPAPATAGDKPQLTIKEGVMQVLGRVAPGGLTAISILERLRVDLGLDYPRTSLSPQLSRLKREGKIELRGGVWSLRSNRNGPGADAPEPS